MAVEDQQLEESINEAPRPVRDASVIDHSHQGLGSMIHAHFASHGGLELDLSNLRDLDADLKRRVRIATLFLEGEWGVELETYEADEERQREQAAESP
jgi:hypothetical protein